MDKSVSTWIILININIANCLVYLLSLISTGFKRDFTREDLFEIDEKELSEASLKKLERVWNPLAKE